MQRTGQRTGIVVGVDGSPSSWDALHWAVGEAHRWRAPLEVLIVDEGQGASGARTSGSRLAQMVADARRLEPAVRVTGTVGHGNVVPALCEASRTARMLVVGHRGHSRFGSGVAAVLAYLHPAGPWMTRGQPPPSDPSLLHASACTTLEATVAPWREKYPRTPIRTLTASATAATST